MDKKTAERHLIIEFNCAPENTEQVRVLLLEYIAPARAEDGCLYFDLYQNDAVPNRFFVLDGWRDQATLDAHRLSANVARVRGLLAPLLSEPTKALANARISDSA